MLKIENGAEDILTKTAANEIAIMEIANGSAIDFSCFKVVLPLSL
ncbi:Archease domain-containing protein [Bacillus pseudomycoides]